MYFLIQIISTLLGIKVNENVMTEKDKAATREQRRNETRGLEERGGSTIQRQSHRECSTACRLGDLLQWLGSSQGPYSLLTAGLLTYKLHSYKTTSDLVRTGSLPHIRFPVESIFSLFFFSCLPFVVDLWMFFACRGQRMTSGILLYQPPPYSLNPGSLTETSVRLEVLSSLPSLSPTGYRHRCGP